MRISHSLSVAALVLVPVFASAQGTASNEIAGVGPNAGVIDFGFLGTTVNGDGARYERYRDLRTGPYFGQLKVNRERKGWVMDLGADNIGRRDQRFDGLFVRPGKFKGYALWDQIPMLMSQTTQTLFTDRRRNQE